MTIITIRVQENDDAIHILGHLLDLAGDDEIEGDFEVNTQHEED